MSLPPDPKMSSLAHVESSDSSQRRERAAIAAQACQTCRTRKSKCDEQRPKCGLCRRLNVECEYREPLPTKKDKTMVHILDALTRLENKFDNLTLARSSTSSEFNSSALGGTPAERSPGAPLAKAFAKESTQLADRETSSETRQPYEHVTVPHKIILWPAIYLYLINSGQQSATDLQRVLEEGTAWFIRRELAKHPHPLAWDAGLPSFAYNTGALERGQSSKTAFPTLTVQQVQEYSDAYFNTFNVLYPLLNREIFMDEVVAKLLREGYGDGDLNTVLALLVYALGQVAIEGVFGRPISVDNGHPSGFRGGTLEEPPGIALFNEARRRLGFVVTQSSLENVQIMLLQATYYEATARHLDFWRATVSASMACQVLIRCYHIDWTSSYGDLIKRAYWTCVLSEDLYHLDLDLPQTGIDKLDDEVPLPYFQGEPDQAQSSRSSPGGSRTIASEQRSHYQYHFLAMIALRRLISRIHKVIHECEHATDNAEPLWRSSAKDSQGPRLQASTGAESTDEYAGPPVAVIREMARQLDSWRALLPRPLQWNDSEKFDFPPTDPRSRRPNEPLFTPDQSPVPIGHKYSLDLVSAQLRTRFYYARFMMYRPFVYKALHFPELMTKDDCDCCALAIKSACLWPLAMAPPKAKKRLVPHLFAWTQNFTGILLILKMCTVNDCLRSIVSEQNVVGLQEIEMTVSLMLEWLKDMRQIEGTAEWSWKILGPMFNVNTT